MSERDCVYPDCMMGGGTCDSQNRGECDPPKPAPPAPTSDAGESPLPKELWIKRTNLIGAKILPTMLLKCQATPKEGYEHWVPTASLRNGLEEIRQRLQKYSDCDKPGHPGFEGIGRGGLAREAIAILTAILEGK